MKKIKYPLLFLIAATTFFSCREVKKHYYDTGELHMEWQVKGDKKDGYARIYFKNGNLKKLDYYENDLLNGEMKGYYETGELEYITHFINGLEEGERKGFYKTGELKYIVKRKNEKDEGIYKEYYPSGEIRYEAFFREGKQTGLYKEYFENGKVKVEQEYTEGVANGDFRSFHPNGRLEMFAVYENGNPIYYFNYDENGILIKEFRELEIISATDSIVQGAEYNALIKVRGPAADNMKMAVEIKSGEKTVAETEYEVKNNEVEFSTVATIAGNYEIIFSIHIPGLDYVFGKKTNLIVTPKQKAIKPSI